MNEDERQKLDAFIERLTACQSQLRAYVLASLGNYSDTADVLQRTNLTLWKKAGEFRPGSDFLPWALTVARFEVLSFLRDNRRDRHVFSDDVVRLMLDASAEQAAASDERQLALRQCLEKLPSYSRDLLWQRYDEGKTIRQIANDSSRSVDSVKCLFLRLRRKLERCIEVTLKQHAV